MHNIYLLTLYIHYSMKCILSKLIESPTRYYPSCHCSDDKTGYVCEDYYTDPPSFKVVTSDILLDVSGQAEHEYFLYTTGLYRLRR